VPLALGLGLGPPVGTAERWRTPWSLRAQQQAAGAAAHKADEAGLVEALAFALDEEAVDAALEMVFVAGKVVEPGV